MIRFPMFKPVGMIDFQVHARAQMMKIIGQYQPRKNIAWDYQLSYQSGIAEVLAKRVK